MSLNGYALIVGGGDGIGKGCAITFAKEGCLGIVVADINLGAAKAVAALARETAIAPGFRAEGIFVDVSKEESVRRAITHAADLFPRIDYCVNSAGVGLEEAREMAEAQASDFARFMDVNVTGAFHVTRDMSKIMKSQEPLLVRGKPARGSIVNLDRQHPSPHSPGRCS